LPFFPVADEQGPQLRARALAFRVAPHYEIRAPDGLHLEPGGRAPAGLVAAVLALADDALEAARQGRLPQRDAVLLRVHELHQRRGQEALRKVAPAVAIFGALEVDAPEIRQIEAVEDDRGALVRRGKLPRR